MSSFACFRRLFWRTPCTLKFLNQVRPKSIKKVNPKKATGVDQLPAKLIKDGSTALAGPTSTIFNFCANKNQFQNDLKMLWSVQLIKKMMFL